MLVKFLKLDEDVKAPHRADKGSSGYDVFSREDRCLNPFERHVFSLGFKLEIEEGFEAQLRSKSGLSSKHGIIVLNSPATIDSSYRGELGAIICNMGEFPYEIKKGDKIAQMVFCEVPTVTWVEGSPLQETSRGEGGFGSTGY